MNLRVLVGWRSAQPYFAHLVDQLRQEAKLSGRVLLGPSGIVIDAEGTEEQIDTFSTLLQNALPFSIFLGGVEPLETIPEDAKALEDHSSARGLFILPRIAQQLLNAQSTHFFDLFIDDGLNPPIRSAWTAQPDGRQAITDPKKSFDHLAQRLIQKGHLDLQTSRGAIRLIHPDAYDQPKMANILITHTRFLDQCGADDATFGLLSALEKPAICVHVPNRPELFGGAAKVQLPYDLVTMLLARALQDHDLDHLYLLPGQTDRLDLGYEGGVQHGQHTQIVATTGGVLIIDGGPLPLRLEGPKSEDMGLCGLVAAVHDGQSILVDHAANLQSHPVTQLITTETGSAFHPHKTQANKAHAAMLSVLIEHRCTDQDAVGGYLSLESDESALLAWIAAERRFRTLAGFGAIADRGSVLLDEIRALDESAPTLLENIAHKYPGLIEAMEGYRFEGAAPLRLFALLALLLGFDSRLSEQDLVSQLIHSTQNPACHGGVKIDFKLNADRQIEWAKAARTLLSFRMADVPPEVLAVSLFESFCDLAVMSLGDMRIALQTPHVAITGDLLAAPVVLNKLEDHFGRFFKLLLSRDLDTKRGAPAVGALYLG